MAGVDVVQQTDGNGAILMDQQSENTIFEAANKSFKNIEMQQMLQSIAKYLERRDMLGYAAARNTRILSSELMEFERFREELITKYGEEQTDENGNPTGTISIKVNSPNFPKFAEEMDKFSQVEHCPNLFRIKAEHVIGELSGSEIMEIDWMIED